MSRQDVSVKIGAEFIGAKAFNAADKAIQKLAKQAAAAFLGGSILNFGKNSVKAFYESERAATSLRQTLTNLGLAFDVSKTENYIKSLSRATGVLDDELVPAYNRLIIATKDSAKAQQILSTAIDVSKGTGKDLESVTSALAKAYLGNTTALQKLGVGLSANELKAGGFDNALQALSNNFYGQAAAAAESYTGQIDRLAISYDQLKERIGKFVLDAGGALSRFFRSTQAYLQSGLTISLEEMAKIKAPYFNKSMAAGFGNVYDTGKLMDQQKKAAAAQLKATKTQTNEIKKQNQLKKGSNLLDLDQIQILAALQGKLSDNEKLRLQLQFALITGNAAEADRLSNELAKSQLLTTGLATAIANLPPALNPFKEFPNYINDLLRQLALLQDAMNKLKMPDFTQQVSGGALTASAAAFGFQTNTAYQAFRAGERASYSPDVNVGFNNQGMPITVQVQLDGRTIAESTTDYQLNNSMSGSFASIGSNGRVRDY